MGKGRCFTKAKSSKCPFSKWPKIPPRKGDFELGERLSFQSIGKLHRRKDVDGAPGEIRTPDLMLRRHSLYPAELRARPTRIPHFAAITARLEVAPFQDSLEWTRYRSPRGAACRCSNRCNGFARKLQADGLSQSRGTVKLSQSG